MPKHALKFKQPSTSKLKSINSSQEKQDKRTILIGLEDRGKSFCKNKL